MALDPNQDRSTAISQMLEACKDHITSDRLTEWEKDFITNVSDQFDRFGDLRQGTVDKLEQIYCKLP